MTATLPLDPAEFSPRFAAAAKQAGFTARQYGEINSCSPEVAPIIMQALKLRVEDVTSPKVVAPK